jgi:uncharacterized Zn-finger protein
VFDSRDHSLTSQFCATKPHQSPTRIDMENLILDTSGGEKFVCPFPECQREFQKRWSLTRHMRKHTGEKVSSRSSLTINNPAFQPFRCGICNKEFVEKCGLVRHEQTHAQERHWECDVPGCKKKFKLKEYLGMSLFKFFSLSLILHSPLTFRYS